MELEPSQTRSIWYQVSLPGATPLKFAVARSLAQRRCLLTCSVTSRWQHAAVVYNVRDNLRSWLTMNIASTECDVYFRRSSKRHLLERCLDVHNKYAAQCGLIDPILIDWSQLVLRHIVRHFRLAWAAPGRKSCRPPLSSLTVALARVRCACLSANCSFSFPPCSCCAVWQRSLCVW